MRQRHMPLILIVTALLCPARGPATDVRPSSDASANYPLLFDAVWQTVNESFYDPRFVGVDWKAVGRRYRPRVEAVHDRRTLPKIFAAYTTARILDAMRKNQGAAAFYTEDVGDQAYRGKVVILQSNDTGSAAEGFTWHMKQTSKATLIGQTTAGYLLGGETFHLKGGWRLTVPTHVAIGPDGKLFKDTPTTPHITVNWTLRDVREGRDPDIAKALEVLTGEK